MADKKTPTNRETLKSHFKNGMIPKEDHFAQLIDASLNLAEDGLTIKDGKVGIDTDVPETKLHVNGSVLVGGFDKVTGNNHALNVKANANYHALYVENKGTGAGICVVSPKNGISASLQGSVIVGGFDKVTGNNHALKVTATSIFPAVYVENKGTGAGIRVVTPVNVQAASLQGSVFVGGYDKVTGDNNALIVHANAKHPAVSVVNQNTGDAIYVENNGKGNAINANGPAVGTTGWKEQSDIRLKQNIHQIRDALKLVCSLRGVSFKWRAADFPKKNLPKGKSIGLIAQEVEELFPFLVSESDGHKALEYTKLVALLIEAVKQQQILIDKQQADLEEIKKTLISI